MQFSLSGLLATMANGLPYSVGAAIAYSGRQVMCVVGDGGLTMLICELATLVKYKLRETINFAKVAEGFEGCARPRRNDFGLGSRRSQRAAHARQDHHRPAYKFVKSFARGQKDAMKIIKDAFYGTCCAGAWQLLR